MSKPKTYRPLARHQKALERIEKQLRDGTDGYVRTVRLAWTLDYTLKLIREEIKLARKQPKANQHESIAQIARILKEQTQ